MFKGQEMAVFKILIGAAFAVMLLGIIYSATANISCPYSAFDEARDLLLQASRDPGKCFYREGVCFEKGAVISKGSLEANLPSVDVSVTGPSAGFKCSPVNQCVFDRKVTLSVTAKCTSSSSCKLNLNSLTC